MAHTYEEVSQIIDILNMKVTTEGRLEAFNMLNGLPEEIKIEMKSLRLGDVDHRFLDASAIIFLIWKNDENPPTYWT